MTDTEKYKHIENRKRLEVKPTYKTMDKLLVSDWEKYKVGSIQEHIHELYDRITNVRVSAHLKHSRNVRIRTMNWEEVARSSTPYQIQMDDTALSHNLADMWQTANYPYWVIQDHLRNVPNTFLAIQTAHGFDRTGQWICQKCDKKKVASVPHLMECYKITSYDVRDLNWEAQNPHKLYQLLHFGYGQIYHNHLNPTHITQLAFAHYWGQLLIAEYKKLLGDNLIKLQPFMSKAERKAAKDSAPPPPPRLQASVEQEIKNAQKKKRKLDQAGLQGEHE